MNLSKYSMPKLEEWKCQLNLTEDEEQVFDMLAKGKTVKEMSYYTCLSTRTIDNRIASIRRKLKEIGVDLCGKQGRE